MKKVQHNKKIIDDAVAKSKQIKLGDMIKNIIIATFVAGLVGFVGGNVYANGLHEQTQRAIDSAVASTPKE